MNYQLLRITYNSRQPHSKSLFHSVKPNPSKIHHVQSQGTSNMFKSLHFPINFSALVFLTKKNLSLCDTRAWRMGLFFFSFSNYLPRTTLVENGCDSKFLQISFNFFFPLIFFPSANIPFLLLDFFFFPCVE